VDQDINEAGHFMRKNLGTFPPVKATSTILLQPAKRTSITSRSFQCRPGRCLPLVFDRLGIRDSVDPESTALVLADENLLIPVLYAIPETVKNLNITMGYPIAGSAVFSLIDSLSELGSNCRKRPDGATGYYYKDVLSILGNPTLKNVYGNMADRVEEPGSKKACSIFQLPGSG
jgi:hypothetical protein